MEFPSWAPKSLIELYKIRLGSKNIEHDIEETLEKYALKYQMSSEVRAAVRERMYRSEILLPKNEGNRLIEKLLTDDRMKNVWAAVGKRALNESYARDLWLACNFALVSWRGEPKLTPTERENLFLEISEAASKLSHLMDRTREFEYYSITQLIDKDKITWLLEELDASSPYEDSDMNIDYAKFSLSDIIPSWKELLTDIGNKALAYSENVPVLLKPNSVNAEINYFIRAISAAFKDQYKQPLHASVANLACVVFDREDIDPDLVRKLVSG